MPTQRIMKKQIIPLCTAALLAAGLGFPTGAQAQVEEKERIVTVEKEYDPEVGREERLDVLPVGVVPSGEKQDIRYGTGAQAYNDSRYRLGPDIMSLTQDEATQGYVLGGGGNYGQADLKAGYLLELTDRDELNVNASFAGTVKERTVEPLAEYPLYGISKWDNHYFRTGATLDYAHYFDNVTLRAAGELGFDNFSYYRFIHSTAGELPTAGCLYPAPTANQGHRKYALGLNARTNEVSTLPLHFDVGTRYSAFRRSHMADGLALTEHALHTTADLSGDLDDNQSLGLRLEMDNMFYSRAYGSYTALQANPYYQLFWQGLTLRAGVKVHYNAGRGQFVQFAPDVAAEWTFCSDYAIYAVLGGGHVLNDFRSLEEKNPYWMSGRLKDAHQRLDGAVGVKGNVGPVFSFDVRGGYNDTKNDACFYNLFSNLTDVAYLYVGNADTKHLYAEAKIDLYMGPVRLGVRGKMYDWKNEDRTFHLMKPKNEVEASLHFPITRRVRVGVGYRYVQRPKVKLAHYLLMPELGQAAGFQSALYNTDRNSLTPAQAAALCAFGGTVEETEYRMRAINNLSANISFAITPRLSLYAQTSNLLNKDYEDFYSYPSHGINFLGGLSFRF